ncbi:hypothetical protein BJY16_007462 [Actinoplanes octamycinicus]|uniref:Uncharacterized protein n=1 Tax=Actinoplanes octamycinicus TaxID=135948 RepID=A0A7W7MBD4_9ACTN|nr:hypothetical protein [Actinoplanes octamycinicus]MBB4744003.1 hypothetical protein [Actinoplanes octamycinicus]GIE58627.1 hypothetical protein Aoc01nite_40290 [Actinoplanes octamycinicus]
MLPCPIGWIDNHDDPRRTVHYLHDLATTWRLHGGSRLVVRPTPGSTNRAELALDILTAVGKNPQVLQNERLNQREWELARAWLAGTTITDLLVDRAHALPHERLLDLAHLAGDVRAGLWLMWSSPDTDAGDKAISALQAAGHTVRRLWPNELIWAAPPRRRSPEPAPARPLWPRLPTADFTTFRAAARRHLTPRAFAAADNIYRDAAANTHRWINAQYGQDPADRVLADLSGYADILTGWLRDEQLGPATDASAALIRLRGTQAALFLHGVLLRWTPDALGADPAARLLGNLTPSATLAITTMARTDHAAAAVLTLHLNHAPASFADLRCSDVTTDGYINFTGRRSLPGIGTGPIAVPSYARNVLASHLAYRHRQRATIRDRFFLHTRIPERDPGAELREATIRTCERINRPAPWLHRNPCRHGTDQGMHPRTEGWLTERGLTLHQLDRDVVARVSTRWRDQHHES